METLSPPRLEQGSEHQIPVTYEDTSAAEIAVTSEGHGDDHMEIPTPANLEMKLTPEEQSKGEAVLRSLGAAAGDLDASIQRLEDVANRNSPTENVELDELDLER